MTTEDLKGLLYQGFCQQSIHCKYATFSSYDQFFWQDRQRRERIYFLLFKIISWGVHCTLSAFFHYLSFWWNVFHNFELLNRSTWPHLRVEHCLNYLLHNKFRENFRDLLAREYLLCKRIFELKLYNISYPSNLFYWLILLPRFVITLHTSPKLIRLELFLDANWHLLLCNAG